MISNYKNLDSKFLITAKMLWDQYKCQTQTDLHDAFLLYIESIRKTKSEWQQLQYFAIPRSMIKQHLSIFNNDQWFYPLFNGEFISIDNYKGQRLNTMQMLQYLGISKQLLQYNEIKNYSGYVSYSLDICLKQFNVDKLTSSVVMQVCKPFSNNKAIDREIKLLSMDEIQSLLRQDVQLDQVIHHQISENVLFFADIDLKLNYGQLDNKQREIMMNDIHTTIIDVLQLYGCKQIETVIVGSDILQSCHIYTNSAVRIDDCNVIINMIRSKLISIGYDKKQQDGYLINRILDSCVYPQNDKKSQIRFPSSLKMTLKDDFDSDSDCEVQQHIIRGKRSIIPENCSLSKFILQPVQIRHIKIVPSYMFSQDTVWRIEIEEKQEQETSSQQLLEREQWFKNEERLRQMRLDIIQKYKGDGEQCLVCNREQKHNTLVRRTQTHFIIKCESKSINIEHTQIQQEETKQQVVEQRCSSIIDQYNLKHISANKYTYENQCPICNREHKSIGNRTLFLNETQSHFSITCVRSKHTLKIRKTLDNTNKQSIVECSIQQSVATQNNKYLKCEILNSHTSFITSPVGTGKTRSIANAVHQFRNEQNRDCTVLFLSTRISFSHTIAEQMKTKYGLSFDLYSDMSVDLMTSKCLMIQIESLPRLHSRQTPFDFIVIDEAVSVIIQISNPIAKQAQIITTLQQFLDTSQHVIVCDALLNDVVINLYRKLINNKSEQMIVNSFQPYQDNVCNFVACETSQQMKQQYIDQLLVRRNDGQCVYSFFDQRQNGLEVYYDAVLKSGIFKQDEILILHGDNIREEIDDYDGNLKHHIQKKKTVYEQGDSRIKKYKLIMTTSTITTGWDSQIEENFNGLHVLFKMENSNAVHIYQNIHRLRNIQSQTFLHTIQQLKETNQPVTIQQYFQRKFGNRYITNSRIMNRADEILQHLIAVNDIMINFLNKHKINVLQAFMRQLGYQIVFEQCKDMLFVNINGKIQKVKEQFVPFDCDLTSLELYASIYSNGVNTIQNGEQIIADNLKEKMVTYYAVMKQVCLGKIKWNQQSLIEEEEQKRCYDIRNNRTIEQIRVELKKIQPLFFVNDPIVQCQDVIMNNIGLQKYANRILKLERQEIDVEDNKAIQQLYARVLYLCFVTDEKHKNRYAQYVEVHNKHKYLFDITCPQKLAIECLKLFNIEYNAKTVSEMIKDCQMKFISKQVKINNKKHRVYSVELIQI